MGLFEGVAEGEQAGFTERGVDERPADRQPRIRGDTRRDNQVGPAGDVREDGRAGVEVGRERDAIVLDQARWAGRGGDDQGVQFFLGKEPLQLFSDSATKQNGNAVERSARSLSFALAGEGAGFIAGLGVDRDDRAEP